MADFRKWFPVLAVAALLFTAASNANAQAAFTCATNAGVPPIVRAEGLSELVGDLILNCTGGTPTATGIAVPQVNIQIFLNTNVTSRLQSDPWSEAMLIIDEPAAANQRLCTAPPCGYTGVGGTGLAYNAAGGTVANVYQGRQAAANSIVWLGVPIDPPGSTATRIIRITNVRANAFQLGTSSTLIPTQIVMLISATGTTSVPINNPQQIVAYIQPGLTSSFRAGDNSGSTPLTLTQCNNYNGSLSSSNTATSGALTAVLRFTEGFASSFKPRTSATFSSADTALATVDQNTLGTIYSSESGFVNQSLGGSNGASGAGIATQGTRLIARFSNIPAGVRLYATVYDLGSIPSAGTSISSYLTASSANLRLVTTDSTGTGSFSATTATGALSIGAPVAELTVSGGSAYAVYEVMKADPLATQTFNVGFTAAYTSNTSSNLPGLGSAAVSANFAPISTVGTASASASIPRFADSPTSRTAFTINACSTNLLFPFVTNQAGFDTGVAISNTSSDPFGTVGQAGACKLNYYGTTTGGGAAPAAQTSTTVAAGGQLVFTLSSGGTNGVAATPGFQGYMIAQCAFQYAHGFAFISDVGAQRVSEAYLALVLDYGGLNRTGITSESLTH